MMDETDSVRIRDLSLKARIREPVKPHSHPFHEIHYVVEGSARFDFDGRAMDVTAGDLFYTRPRTEHRMRAGRGPRGLLQYVAFCDPDEDLVADLADWPVDEPLAIGLGWQSLFHRMAEWSSGSPLEQRLAGARLAAVVYEALAMRQGRARQVVTPPVERMLAHLQVNLERRVPIAELAAAAGLAPAYAARLFRAQLGVPPGRYATGLRMARAAAWLRDDEEPVARVAARIGFDDPYHFSRCFKRWSGLAPSTWRERAAQD